MKHSERITPVLELLDIMLVVEEPDQFITRARRMLLDLRIDLQISEAAAEVREVEGELQPLIVDNTKEKHFTPTEFVRVEGRALNMAKAKPHKPAKGFKCPTCGAPPWHYCAKTSMRGPGNDPLGSAQKHDHPKRLELAKSKRTEA